MSKPRLPEFIWQSVDTNAEFSPYKATDVFGNSWFMAANRERIILKTRDGRHFEAWTAQECWNQYLADGFEFNFQTLLVDALLLRRENPGGGKKPETCRRTSWCWMYRRIVASWAPTVGIKYPFSQKF